MYVRFKKFRIAKSSTKKLICDGAIISEFFAASIGRLNFVPFAKISSGFNSMS
jgi:hypothetical protein